MKADIQDIKAIQTINPMNVCAYLRNAGWTQQESKCLKGRSIWTFEGYEVLVPLYSSFRDYGLRVAELLKTLSVTQEKSQFKIFTDLTTSGADVVRFRLIDPDMESGSIPLDEAALMGTKARELMLAAAAAVRNPKPVYGPRRTEEVLEYARSVRMGQTEHGSFVLKILSPVPPRLTEATINQQMELDGIPPAQTEPFARKVTNQLLKAIRSVRDASLMAAPKGDFTVFRDAVQSGVSANLCEAITGIACPIDQERKLEVSISWALSRPQTISEPSKVLFTPDTFPIMAEAARLFRESEPRDQFEVCGPVIRCERQEQNTEGDITVHGFVDDRPRKIVITLHGTEYEKAVDAHKAVQNIRCTGTLLKEGKVHRLKDPSGINIETED